MNETIHLKPIGYVVSPVEETPGCSKTSGCKAPEILSREAYLLVR